MTGFVGAGRRAVPELVGRVGEVCGGLGFVGTGFWVGMGPLLLPKTAFGADLFVRAKRLFNKAYYHAIRICWSKSGAIVAEMCLANLPRFLGQIYNGVVGDLGE